MKTKNLICYSDPGHAWLAVPYAFFKKIDSVVSPWSYKNDSCSTVFLEEDCDAGRFLDKAKELGYSITFKNKHTNKRSRIRTYWNFSNKWEEYLFENKKRISLEVKNENNF